MLDLVLSLVKAQADAAGAPTRRSPRSAACSGCRAATRCRTSRSPSCRRRAPTRSRTGSAASSRNRRAAPTGSATSRRLLGGHASPATTVTFTLGSADVDARARARHRPERQHAAHADARHRARHASARVEARADLFRIDLVSGAARRAAEPRRRGRRPGGRGGTASSTSPRPRSRAPTRCASASALDAARRSTFVLAADGVLLGTHSYPTLDLTSPDAVMDAVGNTVDDVANQLLAGLGDALARRAPAARARRAGRRHGRHAAGVDGEPGRRGQPATGSSSSARRRADDHRARRAARRARRRERGRVGRAQAAGTAADPWRVALIGPLELEVFATGAKLHVGLAAVDQRRHARPAAARWSRRASRHARDARPRGAQRPTCCRACRGRARRARARRQPAAARLALGGGAALRADHVGLRLGWSPAGGCTADVSAPNLMLEADALDAADRAAGDRRRRQRDAAARGLGRRRGAGRPPRRAHRRAPRRASSTRFGWIAGAGGRRRRPGHRRAAAARRLRRRPAGRARRLAAAPGAERSSGPRRCAAGRSLRRRPRLPAVARGFSRAPGHPDDPYRFALAPILPNVASGSRLQASTPPRRRARGPAALAAGHRRPGARRARRRAASRGSGRRDVRELVDGRDVAGGLTALAQRWVGGDGRIVPPAVAPTGVTVDTLGRRRGAARLAARPRTSTRPRAGDHRVRRARRDGMAGCRRRAPVRRPHRAGSRAAMFAPPAAATGDWFVALGTRADCRAAPAAPPTARPSRPRGWRACSTRWPTCRNDIALVALAGAGHAARLAAEAQPQSPTSSLLGTPLAADRAHRACRPSPRPMRCGCCIGCCPPRPTPTEPGRRRPRARPRAGRRDDGAGAARRPGARSAPAGDRAGAAARAGLTVTGGVRRGRPTPGRARDDRDRRRRPRRRARRPRAGTPPPRPPACRRVCAGSCPTTPTARSRSRGCASLTLFGFDDAGGARQRRASCASTLRVADRLGWLTATPDLELRAITLDLALPLGGARRTRRRRALVLHDARVFGQSWERLVLGNAAGSTAAGSSRGAARSARAALRPAVQRVTADLQGSGVARAVEPAARARHHGAERRRGRRRASISSCTTRPASCGSALAAAGAQIQAALAALLGPLAARSSTSRRARVRVQGGGADASGALRLARRCHRGLAGPAWSERHAAIGPSGALPTVGGLQLQRHARRRPGAVAARCTGTRRVATRRRGGALAAARRRAAAAHAREGGAQPRRPRRARDDAPRRRHRAPADRRRARRASACSPARRATPSARCARSPGCSPIRPAGCAARTRWRRARSRSRRCSTRCGRCSACAGARRRPAARWPPASRSA